MGAREGGELCRGGHELARVGREAGDGLATLLERDEQGAVVGIGLFEVVDRFLQPLFEFTGLALHSKRQTTSTGLSPSVAAMLP